MWNSDLAGVGGLIRNDGNWVLGFSIKVYSIISAICRVVTCEPSNQAYC